MVMSGHVVESCVACLRSFSAFVRMSAALRRSASDSIGKPLDGGEAATMPVRGRAINRRRRRHPAPGYCSLSIPVVVPSVLFPGRRLFWYDRIPPPLECNRPLTFDMTVERPSTTKLGAPKAATPPEPLSVEETRSTVIDMVPPPAVFWVIPLIAFPDTTLSRK